ncbi:MAG TPA: DUF349 domain-containing protein [Albitalea sp.]|nr:DUF349 domain-containing protein [Albitalea sp.]
MFKKNEAPVADQPADAANPGAPAMPTAPEATAWQLRLQAALGDDDALLALARDAAPVDVKVAAIGALAGIGALKLAEREYRDHDRRVHRVAKQRLLLQVGRHETDEQALRLIDAAKALVGEPLIAVNRLVDLDRAWQALDPALLDEPRRAEFTALMAQLAALTRERGDQRLRLERWTADARAALAHLQAACAAAAAGTPERSPLDAAGAAARAVVEAAPPEGDSVAALRDSLHSALQNVAALEERLGVLDALQQAAPAPSDAAARWQQLAPLADATLADALNHRFAQWQQARDEAQQARRSARRERAVERERGLRVERTGALAAALEQAEAALAAGQLADTNKHLVEVDELLHGGASAGALRPRIDALQAEYARLKGWQHWGGGLARDELVLQAEALAAATSGDANARIVKLSIKQQADVIDDLRARWKELDRLGGATSRALWQRFDAALKTAYQPVAAHLDVQRAARRQNLEARNGLVDALNAVALADANDADAVPDWKAIAAALAHFHTEWRKLGPVEHTVPHKERETLMQRMGAAIARLEVPLNDVRRGAQLVREQLIVRAKALAAEAGSGAQGRELVDKVRQLQAEWQQHARELPLARAAENALWAEFKADVDAVFSARDAVVNAREAQFKAHGAERAALIERLSALNADTPPADLKRTLAEVDAQWQRAGPAPRSEAAALDARFRAARDSVREWLAGSAQRQWHATCDALLAKLALCEAFEQEADPAEAKAALEQRLSALPALPASWEQAFAQRLALTGAAAAGAARITASTDELLLQLEAAFALSSPPAFEAARRQMKLQAMKAALEGRASAAAAPAAPAQLLAAALGRTALDTQQRERLRAVIDAVRARGPSPP